MTKPPSHAELEYNVRVKELPNEDATILRYTRLGFTTSQAQALETTARTILTISRTTILEIGMHLLLAKKDAGRYGWSVFLDRVGMSERMAEHYMNVAFKFGENRELFDHLPKSALYAMAAPSADQEAVQEIIVEVEQGIIPTVAEVKQRVAPPPSAPAAPTTYPLSQLVYHSEGSTVLVDKLTKRDDAPMPESVEATTTIVQGPLTPRPELKPTPNLDDPNVQRYIYLTAQHRILSLALQKILQESYRPHIAKVRFNVDFHEQLTDVYADRVIDDDSFLADTARMLIKTAEVRR